MNYHLKSIPRVLLIFFVFILMSCKSTQSWTTKKEMKGIYIPDFKLLYFKKLMIVGYNNTNEIKNIVSADRSGFSEPILFSIEDYELIDSFVKLDNNNMIQDSINRIGRTAEGTEGKHVFAVALRKYQSKWLDNLAKERFKMYWRKEKQKY